jgi:hypothetical protein
MRTATSRAWYWQPFVIYALRFLMTTRMNAKIQKRVDDVGRCSEYSFCAGSVYKKLVR